MSGKTFEQYAAEYAKEPYPFPMPGGASIPIAYPVMDKERAAVAAANAAPTVGDGLIAGMRVYVAGDDGNDINGYGDEIAEAWGKLPSVAFQDAVNEMRDYFGTKNS